MPTRRAPRAREQPNVANPPDDPPTEAEGAAQVAPVGIVVPDMDAKVELSFFSTYLFNEENDANPATLPHFPYNAAAVAACSLGSSVADVAGFKVASSVATRLSKPSLKRIYDTLRSMGALSSLDHRFTWPSYLMALSSSRRSATPQQLDALTIRVADLESNEAFDRPAPPSAAAGGPGRQPGPRDLIFLRAAHWNSFSDAASSDLPLLDLALLLLALGDVSTYDARAPPDADCQIAARQITALLIRRYGVSDPTGAHYANLLPTFLKSVRLPLAMLSRTADPKSALLDLVDGFSLHVGTRQERTRVEHQRIEPYVEELEIDPLVRILQAAEVSQRPTIFEDLCGIYLSSQAAERYITLRTSDLNRKLLEVRFLLDPVLEDGSSVDEILDLLRVEAEVHSRPNRGPPLAADDSSSTTQAPRSSDYNDDDIKKALRELNFIEAKARIMSYNFGDGEQHVGILAEAYTCNVPVITRYLDKPVDSLRSRDELFRQLDQVIYARNQYFSLAHVTHYLGMSDDSNTSDDIPSHLRDYCWSEDSLRKWLAFKADTIEWSDDALHFKSHATANKIALTPKRYQWRVVSSVECQRDFMASQYLAYGYPAEVAEGYTIVTLLDELIVHIRWADTLGDQEREQALSFGERKTREQLELNEQRRKTAAHILDRPLGAVAPASCVLVLSLRNFRRDASALVALRRTFPHILPSTSVRGLPGVPLGGAAASGEHKPPACGSQGKPKDRKASPSSSKRKAGSGKMKRGPDSRTADEPGAKAALAKYLHGGASLFLSGRVYDLNKIANRFNLRPTGDDKPCFPVLLSKKEGEARLSLCPCFGKAGHESLGSAAHVRPANFDLAKIGAECSRKASSAECEECNYNTPEVNGRKKSKS